MDMPDATAHLKTSARPFSPCTSGAPTPSCDLWRPCRMSSLFQKFPPNRSLHLRFVGQRRYAIAFPKKTFACPILSTDAMFRGESHRVAVTWIFPMHMHIPVMLDVIALSRTSGRPFFPCMFGTMAFSFRHPSRQSLYSLRFKHQAKLFFATANNFF
ncbi:hypothetical protein BDP27DRAFT_1338453 [Rhodocollybia butyracea]|uniref:Uncharacterized protein n=1 Tax=Rhodocollybia butyracea TaxID=206335 RepID=A0A9P5PEH2_9AGAR|nr:hypothetical protein BDP27DRAFT_1338453 [Rhodocollybia butyracea]